MQAILGLIVAVVGGLPAAPAQDWSAIRKILGPGVSASGGTCSLERYRRDLQIQNSNGMVIPPEMGLRSTATFVAEGLNCRIQGEICLQRGEFDPVIDDLRKGGLSVTGLGSRFAGTDPAIYSLRFEGMGALEKLAYTVKHALAELGSIHQINEGFNRTGNPPTVDWSFVSLALGSPLKQIGSSGVRRAAKGNGWVTFGGCPCGRTMVAGEFNMNTEKLQAVIDELRARHISITAVSIASDRKVRVDFESEGDAVRLAEALRKPLAEVAGQSGD